MNSGFLKPAYGSDAAAPDTDAAFMTRSVMGRRMSPQSPNEALQPEAPPPPPPKPPNRRRPTLSALSGFMSFLVIVAIGALAGLVWSENRISEPGPLTADKVVFIAPHTDLPDIIEKLDSDGVIDSPLTFNLILGVERKRGKVRAGEYLFKQHASLRSVIDTLVSGKQILHGITIPEGLTSAQIVQRLRENDLLVGEIRDVPKDGSLLPETYKVARGTSRMDVIIKMQEDDRRVVEQIWARRAPDLPLRSPFELVTLASIVEKETGKADERPHVAGVFINRLTKRMRLQSDPTIVYGLVGGQGTLGHSITRAELDKRTPYNTYQIDGLPPGPISNPGRAALEAVANPSRTQDLYFVADGTGGHTFASNVDDHNRNVQRWRQIERDAKDKVDVDKLSPNAVTAPPAKSNQRSDASDAAFGALPTRVATMSNGRVASFSDPEANHGIQAVADATQNIVTPKGRHGASKAPPVSLDTAMAAGIDTLGFTLAETPSKGSDLLDGPVPDRAMPPGGASVAGPHDQEAKAVAALSSSDHPTDLFADPDPTTTAPIERTSAKPPAHPKVYDVSEGTALDPLRNKTYDLNSGKTIPSELVHP